MRDTSSVRRARQGKIHRLPVDEWERGWQSYWKQAGFTPYELPVDGRGEANDEYQFLMTARTRDREIERLGRINAEFVRGFKGLAKLGPAVTVFGSARFKQNHPYYKLRTIPPVQGEVIEV